jgi:hypothetical protein
MTKNNLNELREITNTNEIYKNVFEKILKKINKEKEYWIDKENGSNVYEAIVDLEKSIKNIINTVNN